MENINVVSFPYNNSIQKKIEKIFADALIKVFLSSHHENTDHVSGYKLTALQKGLAIADTNNIFASYQETMNGKGFGGLPTDPMKIGQETTLLIQYLIARLPMSLGYTNLADFQRDVMNSLYSALTLHDINSTPLMPGVGKNSRLYTNVVGPDKTQSLDRFKTTIAPNFLKLVGSMTHAIYLHLADYNSKYPKRQISDAEKISIVKAAFQDAVLYRLGEQVPIVKELHSSLYQPIEGNPNPMLHIPLSANTILPQTLGLSLQALAEDENFGQDFLTHLLVSTIKNGKSSQVGFATFEGKKQALYVTNNDGVLTYKIDKTVIDETIFWKILMAKENEMSCDMLVHQGVLGSIGLFLAGVHHIGSERGIRDMICTALETRGEHKNLNFNTMIQTIKQQQLCSDEVEFNKKTSIYITGGMEFASLVEYEDAIKNKTILRPAGYGDGTPNFFDVILAGGYSPDAIKSMLTHPYRNHIIGQS